MRAGTAWQRREVAVARYLADRGAPVVAPSGELPPGPHERDGFTMTFWELVPDPHAPLDAAEAGRRLRACHEALAGYGGDLETMAATAEVGRVLERVAANGLIGRSDLERLREIGAGVSERVGALRLPHQAVHGDAGLGNVLSTPDGPRWNDWEDTFRGPVEWDLACVQATGPPFGERDPELIAAAVRGYGDGIDADALSTLIDARRHQVTVWGIAVAATRPDRDERIARHLGWYR